MDNHQHKIHLESSLLDVLKLIDSLRILPKNRLLLYQRYVLSKLSWHLTVANLSKTWVIENLDNVVVRFVRKWSDLPISATLSGISLPRNQFGLNLLLPSVKFLQCQTVLRNALKSSSNDAIKSLWRSTSFGMNIQYDTYRNIKQVLKAVRHSHTDKLRSNLTSQGFLITFLLNHSLKTVNSLWSSAQSKLPKTSLTSLSGNLIPHLRLGKISSCGISPKHLTVPSASSQSLFSTLLQVVDLISLRAASHGDMTLH